jgi:hypothetical protein
MTSSDVLTALSGAVKGQPGAQGPQGPPARRARPARPASPTSPSARPPATTSPAASPAPSRAAQSGERVIGGGGRFAADGSAKGTLTMSAPDVGVNGEVLSEAWTVELNASGPGHAIAFAVCAKVGA